MNGLNLASIAQSLVADGRGILAADESTGTITKRFDALGVASTEENRRSYREVLFTTAGLGECVSGAILYDETIRQAAQDGTPFPEVLAKQNIHPGIKVDTGAKPLAGSPDETVTEGLDGLGQRVAEYYGLGARFAKWRAVIKIGEDIPSPYCIETNAHALARYARLCQDGGLVPIVEPEVLMDGDHDIDRCDQVTTEDPARGVRRLAPPRRLPRRHAAQAQHGDRRPGLFPSGGRRGGGGAHRSVPAPYRSGGGAGRRISFRRAERADGDRAPERHERQVRRPTVEAQLLLWPGAAGRRLEELAGVFRQHGAGPEGP